LALGEPGILGMKVFLSFFEVVAWFKGGGRGRGSSKVFEPRFNSDQCLIGVSDDPFDFFG
jgi:hypothetical protein